MADTKFTPGPWAWCMGLQHHITAGEIEGVHIPSKNLIANVPSGRANAHLIAAAPELYRALEIAIGRLDEMDPGFVHAKMRAALAKARGELNE